MTQFLDETTRDQVQQAFNALIDPVSLVFFSKNIEDCPYCEHTFQLLQEIEELSEKIELIHYKIENDSQEAARYGVEMAPGIIVAGKKDGQIVDYGIRFSGVPAGHEFTSLIRDILMVSGGNSGLSDETRRYLKKLNQPVHLQVFVTPTCPYCPPAVVLAHQLAMESKVVTAEMVEAMEFPDLSMQFGVSGVPHTVINGGAGEIIGSVPEAVLIQKIKDTLATVKG